MATSRPIMSASVVVSFPLPTFPPTPFSLPPLPLTSSLPLPLPLAQTDPELAEAIVQNTRRYVTIFSEAVSELLPLYKQREVSVLPW